MKILAPRKTTALCVTYLACFICFSAASAFAMEDGAPAVAAPVQQLNTDIGIASAPAPGPKKRYRSGKAKFQNGADIKAELFFQDSRFAYQVVPWTTALSNEKETRHLIQATRNAFVSEVRRLYDRGLIPQNVMGLKDLETLEIAEEAVEKAMNYLDRYYRDHNEGDPVYFADPMELIPDAFMVFAGKKGSVGLGVSVGGSAMIGAIVMPVKVFAIDKMALGGGEFVSTFYTVKIAPVAIINANLGGGGGASAGFRVGAGLIWGSKNFTNPAQFWGGGAGVSSDVMVGPVGVNIKGGYLVGAEMPSWSDYLMYVMAGVDFGAGAAIEPFKVNGTAVLPLERFLAQLNMHNAEAGKAVKYSADEVEAAMERELSVPRAQ